MSNLFMGVDIGTSGVRAALFDARGYQMGLCYKQYPMICKEQDMAELDPDEVFQSLVTVIRQCIDETGIESRDIEAIGMSTQLFSFIVVDSCGNCLTNALTWADTRPLQQAQMIQREFDTVRLYNRTGCRVQHPMYALSKILWCKKARPELYKKAVKFVTIKEYILFKLFGEFVIDITDASATACFNIHTFSWDKEILKNILECGQEMFGTPVDCTHTLYNMKKEYADKMGIRQGTPVVVGSGDGMLANLGCGVFDDSSVSSTIGTSGALRIASGKPLLDVAQRTWCYCFTRDTWVAGGAINNGGIVLKWLCNAFGDQLEKEMRDEGTTSIYKLFDLYAERIVPGCDGLLFLPLLTGERSPNWNAAAKGTIHGLQLIHGRMHLVRAAMEGVMYRMFSVYEAITQVTSNIKQIKANGGYVNSGVWLQIQADMFNKEIAVAGVTEAAAFGAAYVAMAAAGAVESLKVPLKCMEPREIVKPDTSKNKIYMDAYKKFQQLYKNIYGAERDREVG